MRKHGRLSYRQDNQKNAGGEPLKFENSRTPRSARLDAKRLAGQLGKVLLAPDIVKLLVGKQRRTRRMNPSGEVLRLDFYRSGKQTETGEIDGYLGNAG